MKLSLAVLVGSLLFCMALEISFRKNTDREKKNLLETPFTSSGCHRKFDFFFFLKEIICWYVLNLQC